MRAQAEALATHANARFWQGDYGRAQALYDPSLALFRTLDDPLGTANVLLLLANLYLF